MTAAFRTFSNPTLSHLPLFKKYAIVVRWQELASANWTVFPLYPLQKTAINIDMICFSTVCWNFSQKEYFRKALKIAKDSCILLPTRHHPFGGFLFGDDNSIHHYPGDVLLFCVFFRIFSFIVINRNATW